MGVVVTDESGVALLVIRAQVLGPAPAARVIDYAGLAVVRGGAGCSLFFLFNFFVGCSGHSALVDLICNNKIWRVDSIAHTGLSPLAPGALGRRQPHASNAVVRTAALVQALGQRTTAGEQEH